MPAIESALMTVSVKRSGGFAGLTETLAVVNTADCDAARRRQIEQLVERIGFFQLPAHVSSEAIGADLFRYEIEVNDEDRRHTVAFDDVESPETAPLRGLVDALIGLQ